MKKLLISLALLGVFSLVHAADNELFGLKAALAKVTATQPDTIKESPIKGLYEITFGPEVYYMSADGRFLFNGEVHDLVERVNLTEEHRKGARKTLLDSVNPDSMIIYKAKGETKHVISVFTDIDCGYCRKLHSGMQEMNDLGIEVRYLSYPRAGVDSESYNKAVSVWCAGDRNQALTSAKANEPVKVATCDNPVQAEMALGKRIGVTGTPAIVLEDGTLLPGYLPPMRLLQTLESRGS